jgi:hypothetical protein
MDWSDALSGDVMIHWRVMGISTLGVPEEIVTVMVTRVGSSGAINNAFNAGGAEMMLPALASQVIIALGGTNPFKVSGICSLTFILQSFGRTVTVPSGVDSVPQAAAPSDIKTAMMKITLRDTYP